MYPDKIYPPNSLEEFLACPTREPCRIRLRQPADRRQFDRCPVGLSEPSDHRGQAWREFGLCRPIGVRVSLNGKINLQRIGAAITSLARPQ